MEGKSDDGKACLLAVRQRIAVRDLATVPMCKSVLVAMNVRKSTLSSTEGGVEGPPCRDHRRFFPSGSLFFVDTTETQIV